jgi:BirA family biotin operon repressor/biotin-[acetyl-CoA-carboxylase] ligase
LCADRSAHTGLPFGYSLAAFEEIDSTNEEAKRRAEAGERGPLWIIAERQTAGRGRRGRAWDSPAGNLMTTLLLDPVCSPGEAARLSFVAALSVHDLVSNACPGQAAALKWPNDVLLEGKKCAGILLEAASASGHTLPWVAIGIGVNLVHAPENTPFPACALSQYGATLTPDQALTRLAAAWEKWFALWREQGFSPIRTAWLERASGLAAPIAVRLASGEMRGRFAGLDADGGLMLHGEDGAMRIVTSGEVFLPVTGTHKQTTELD